MGDTMMQGLGALSDAELSEALDHICLAEGVTRDKLISVEVFDGEIRVRHAPKVALRPVWSANSYCPLRAAMLDRRRRSTQSPQHMTRAALKPSSRGTVPTYPPSK